MNIYQQDFKQTPEIFTLITEHRNEEAKQHLQKYPNEINLKGWMDNTPLHIAAGCGNTEMVTYLVENGAEVNAERSGVYLTPLCWATNYEIAQYLLLHGATMNDRELYCATQTNKPELVDLLLTNGAAIDANEPQYLISQSIPVLEIYLKHGIALTGCDKNKSNLLHKLTWIELPDVFDFAYTHGCPWTKDSSQRTPYTKAKESYLQNMLDHFQQHYASLIDITITAVDAGNYSFEKIYFLKQHPSNPNWFIALTENSKLVRYAKHQQELQVDQVAAVDVPIIRNFDYDKNGHLLLPTADDKLLLIDVTNFKLINSIPLEEGLGLDQITYLPAKNIFIGSSAQWRITILNEDFRRIHSEKSKGGPFMPVINQQENLIAFNSYNEQTFFDLYEFPNSQEVNYMHRFFETWDDHSLGFDFLNNEMAVTYTDRLAYYNFSVGVVVKLWEMDLSQYPSTYSCYVVFIDADTLCVGKGKTLFYINRQQRKITTAENLPLTAEIKGLYLDDSKEFLIIKTNEELIIHAVLCS